DGRLRLDPGADRDEARRVLAGLPGITPAAVAALRARVLGDPDVTPPGTDLPEAWRPWRSYAVHHLRVAEELTD
ncbi:3-methyladenine DNA glycosylase 2, partial [Streptomyces seoulensis]